jgi:TonB family protein
MRRIACLALLLSICATVGLSQDTRPTPAPQQHEKDASAEDKVYREDEVDVKAKPKGQPGIKVRSGPGAISFTPDCRARGEATLRLVVDKKGKVAAVTLVKASGCGAFDAWTVRDTRRTKFIPALKEGRPVSQEMTIITSYEWPRGRK